MEEDAEDLASVSKLNKCYHFHYESVELQNVKLTCPAQIFQRSSIGEIIFNLNVENKYISWIVVRSIMSFQKFDLLLHHCIYERSISKLMNIGLLVTNDITCDIIIKYINQLTFLIETTNNLLTCGQILNWLELDNKGWHVLPLSYKLMKIIESIKVEVIKVYEASNEFEITLKEGEEIEILYRPPGDTGWLQAKSGTKIGYIPSDCVVFKVQNKENVPLSNVLKREELKKIILLYKNRPSKQYLKSLGIIKQTIFGCELIEYLTSQNQDVPKPVIEIIKIIERKGMVEGIYRVSTNIDQVQKLRLEYESGKAQDMHEAAKNNIHNIAALLKMYFRELQNPLFTYQLYEKFLGINPKTEYEMENIEKLKSFIKLLPPLYFKTCKYLFAHFVNILAYEDETRMNAYNIATVWMPNLLRTNKALTPLIALNNMKTINSIGEMIIKNYSLIFFDETMTKNISHEEEMLRQNLASESVDRKGSPIFDVIDNHLRKHKIFKWYKYNTNGYEQIVKDNDTYIYENLNCQSKTNIANESILNNIGPKLPLAKTSVDANQSYINCNEKLANINLFKLKNNENKNSSIHDNGSLFDDGDLIKGCVQLNDINKTTYTKIENVEQSKRNSYYNYYNGNYNSVTNGSQIKLKSNLNLKSPILPIDSSLIRKTFLNNISSIDEYSGYQYSQRLQLQGIDLNIDRLLLTNQKQSVQLKKSQSFDVKRTNSMNFLNLNNNSVKKLANVSSINKIKALSRKCIPGTIEMNQETLELSFDKNIYNHKSSKPCLPVGISLQRMVSQDNTNIYD